MAAAHAPRHGSDKRSARPFSRKDAERLKKLTGQSPRAEEDIQAILRRNAWAFAVGIVGAALTFGVFWLNRAGWAEQTAMLLLLVTFTFLVLVFVTLVSFAGLAGESYAVNRLKMVSALSDAEEESTKSLVLMEVVALMASTSKWNTWDIDGQKRLMTEVYEICTGVATYKRPEEVVESLQQFRRELAEHAPDKKIPAAIDKKLKNVEQLVLT